ncbi:MAG: zinc ribbon domain-containing protein [Gracilibacteraceae bacterium]|jgi:hypothetical protein|nr:zinc ribbon domain-containing protein [Gracilibacteraceae bacterium]
MYCENCGKEVSAPAKFCRYCGADTAAGEEAIPSGGETPAIANTDQEANAEQNENADQNEKTAGGKFGNRRTAALFAAAVALAVLVAAGVFIFQRLNENRYIDLVRDISVSPNQKLGELADEILTDSQWDTILASDGERYVNIRGRMSYISGVTVPVTIQYKVTANGEARYHAMQIDGHITLNFDPVALLAGGLDYLTDVLNAVTGNGEAARICSAHTRVLEAVVVMIAGVERVPASCIDIDSEGILYLDGPEYYTRVGSIVGDGRGNYIRAWPSCGETPFAVDDGIVKNTCAHLRSDINITRTYPDAPSLPSV